MQAVMTRHAPPEQLLELLDAAWFGLDAEPRSPRRGARARFRAAALQGDPLEQLAPLAPALSPALLAQQQAAAGGANTTPYALLAYQQQLGVIRLAAGPGSAAASQQQALAAAASPPPAPGSGGSGGGSGSVVPVPSSSRATNSRGSSSRTSSNESGKAGSQAIPVAPSLPKEQAARMSSATASQQQQRAAAAAASQHQLLASGADEGPAPYVLGTWAQRQFLMPLHAPSQPKAVASGQGEAAAVAAAAMASAAAATEAALGAAREDRQRLAARRQSGGTSDEDEAVTQAAWRWRFTKRWQAEQARGPLQDGQHASVGDGGMEDALQYLAACGENWALARGHSGTESGGPADSRLLGTLGTPSLLGAELLVGEGSFSGHGSSRGGGLLQSTGSEGFGLGPLSREASLTVPAAGGGSGGGGSGAAGSSRGGEATQQVNGLSKRARELLAAQSDINKAATQRWREVQAAQASDLWVGALLEGVEIDDWGKYKWLLLRLRDRTGRTKLLVRGANYASEAKIVEALHRQMMAACSAHGLSPEAIEVVGGGLMEWHRHKDRHLHISGGYVAPCCGGPSTPSEVMSLAAVLARSHLPMHYRVTSEGGRTL